MQFPIRVDLTKGEVLFFDADNILVTPEELVAEANDLYLRNEGLTDAQKPDAGTSPFLTMQRAPVWE